MFVLKVNKSSIRVLETEPIYGDSKNIYTVVLLFNEDWNGLTKVITFDNGEKTSPTIADASRTIVTTSIPWELLMYPGTIRVSVSGAKNNLVVLPSQFCILGKIKKGSTVDYPSDTDNPPPSPSFADQVFSLIAQKGDTVEFADGWLYLKSDGKVISQTEIQNGSSPITPDDITVIDGVTITNKSYFESQEVVNDSVLLKNVTIEYLNSDNLIERMTYKNDIVQLVSVDDYLSIYSIEGKVVKFCYSEDGAIIFSSVDYSTPGSDGASAYEIAVQNGFVGTEQDWLESLKGAKGKDGTDGKSAYQLAVEAGFDGTLEEWLASLHGEDGLTAYDIAVNNGYLGTEEEWIKSLVGPSAYDIAVSNGFKGNEEEWLASLHGKPGAKGTKGDPGKSAYEVAVSNGFSGDVTEWLSSLKGVDGKSAYEIAVEHGYTGTEDEFATAIQPIKTYKNIVFSNTDSVPTGTVRLIGCTFDPGAFFTDDYVYIANDTISKVISVYTLDGVLIKINYDESGTLTSSTRKSAYETSAPEITETALNGKDSLPSTESGMYLLKSAKLYSTAQGLIDLEDGYAYLDQSVSTKLRVITLSNKVYECAYAEDGSFASIGEVQTDTTTGDSPGSLNEQLSI